MSAPFPITHSSPHNFLGPSGALSKLAQPSGFLYLETAQVLDPGTTKTT